MKILALDCSAAWCGVCAWHDGEVIAVAEEKMERGQDARLVPILQQVMDRAGWAFAMLDRIAVGRGPGSFTGLRIALATARGLGLATQTPVIGLDRFSIHREQQAEIHKDLLVVLESRREELYTRFFPLNELPDAPFLMTGGQIQAFLAQHATAVVAGDAFAVLRDVVDEKQVVELTMPECVTCATLAASASCDDPIYLPRPLYLRPPDVTFPSSGKTC